MIRWGGCLWFEGGGGSKRETSVKNDTPVGGFLFFFWRKRGVIVLGGGNSREHWGMVSIVVKDRGCRVYPLTYKIDKPMNNSS